MRLPLLLSFAVACNDPTTADGTPPIPEAPDLGAPGPYSAGTTRLDIVGADGEPLVAQLWYPTTEPGAPVVYDGLFAGEATADAPADCSATRPLLAFSHGSSGIRYQSAFLTEHAATHGYVVVAPDHRGNTFLDLVPDFEALVLRRPQDVSDAVDAALADGRVEGCLDGGDYAIAGHSFGGYTSFAAAGATVNTAGGTTTLGDPRVTAVVALAPWDGAGTITDGTAEVEVPTLVLTGALDETTPLAQVRRLWDPLGAAERWLGVFPEAGHYSFSPVACVLFVGDGCGEGYLPTDRVEELTNVATLAFLEGLRGTPGAAEQLPTDAPELEWEQ
jgi:predicted dienelactone hydrolase